MGEMVERVARAIAEFDCDLGKAGPADCDEINGNCQCRKLARAAIAAMREPTDAMVNEAWGTTLAAAFWRAMIDAALSA